MAGFFQRCSSSSSSLEDIRQNTEIHQKGAKVAAMGAAINAAMSAAIFGLRAPAAKLDSLVSPILALRTPSESTLVWKSDFWLFRGRVLPVKIGVGGPLRPPRVPGRGPSDLLPRPPSGPLDEPPEGRKISLFYDLKLWCSYQCALVCQPTRSLAAVKVLTPRSKEPVSTMTLCSSALALCCYNVP